MKQPDPNKIFLYEYPLSCRKELFFFFFFFGGGGGVCAAGQ